MSVPITSSALFSNEGYPIPTAFSVDTTQRISVVNGPSYVVLESRRGSSGIYTSSANFTGSTIDGASPTFSNLVDTSIVSGDFITAGVVGQKGRTGSLLVNINRDLPANEVFIKLETSNPDTYISEIANDASFVFNIITSNTGDSNDDQFALPLVSTFGNNNVTSSVDWGDGRTDLISASAQGEKTHTYSAEGSYTIKMTPTTGTVGIKGFRFNDGGDKLKITRVENWGELNWDSNTMFNGCTNLSCTAPDFLHRISSNLSTTFGDNDSLTSLDVTRWDLNQATAINLMFSGCDNLSDFDPSSWDVSNVTNMKFLFRNCESVDFSLADWNLSSLATANGPTGLFKETGGATVAISTANYDATLIGWASSSNTPTGAYSVDFGSAKYTGTAGTEASASRSVLEQKGWTIADGGTA